MKKTFITNMPDRIGAFLTADQALSSIGVNITRVSYNKAIDTHTLFLEAEGDESALAEAEKLIDNPVKLEGVIRSKTMKSGGVGYVKPSPESFPTLKDMNNFITGCGAVPTLAWLNGLSAGENALDELLALHKEYGTAAATLIPARNVEGSSPEKSAALQKELDRFIMACAEEDLPLLAGTEMNAPGQLLVDDFENPALKKHLALLLLGVDNFC